ncbi:MAG: KpsF/GutQ family sugar-phosphate isomerase [Desulfamplus sp.]|nr:KpsF/GutQ family sugar-phosphate isomerase [Desulfamplus sp.]MBF0302966.1 KpsF/GutQ family sugar-phosphate isomerase [Desulfamplus sp.]MBF0411109.1 KpsF/GutQ family sugar-phosphate isomerase [Desulfamplus sp.]
MIIDEAISVLKQEAESVLHLTEKIGYDFERMVEVICNSTGRVVISGIGKSGLIGRKIVATLCSTGTNAMFLHPVEAMHGDLGMVSKDDVFIAISNSGETGELNLLLPSIRSLGCPMIAFTGNPDSTMARKCDIVIDTGVEKEACPLGLAPTCSTTAQLAMGDALAVVLINKKHFKLSDFKKSHPGGALGQRLSCMVGEIMFSNLSDSSIPSVISGASMSEAIAQMDRFKIGAVFILQRDNTLAGIITDGDIRHCIAEKNSNASSITDDIINSYGAISVDFNNMNVEQVMTKKPHVISPELPLYDALNIMEQHQITILPVINSQNRLVGILHLHDILGKGAFKFTG